MSELHTSMEAGTTKEVTLKPAGFWRRLAARLLDVVITSIGVSAIGMVLWAMVAFFLMDAGELFSGGNVGTESAQTMNRFSLGWNVISFALTLLYMIFLIASKWQATLGKRALNVYVTTDDNQRITPLRATMRTLTFSMPGILAFACMIVFLIAIFDIQAEMSDSLNIQNKSDAEIQAAVKEYSERVVEVFQENAGYFLAAFVVFFFGKLAMIAPIIFRKDKKGLHDIICGTRVYCGKPEEQK